MCDDEFDLEQLLSDPLTRLVMSSDAVEEGDIRRLAGHAGVRRRAAEQVCFAAYRGSRSRPTQALRSV